MRRGLALCVSGLAVIGVAQATLHARAPDHLVAGSSHPVQENAVRRALIRWFELAKARDWRGMNNAAARRWSQEYNTQVGVLRITRSYEDFVIARWDIGEIHLSNETQAIGVVSVITDRGTRTMMVRLERDPNGRWGVDPDSAVLSAAPGPGTAGPKRPGA